jgi:hypothetical protein
MAVDLRYWYAGEILSEQIRVLLQQGTHPTSAILMAGSRTSAKVTLPLPNSLTVSTQAAAVPVDLSICGCTYEDALKETDLAQ